MAEFVNPEKVMENLPKKDSLCAYTEQYSRYDIITALAAAREETEDAGHWILDGARYICSKCGYPKPHTEWCGNYCRKCGIKIGE